MKSAEQSPATLRRFRCAPPARLRRDVRQQIICVMNSLTSGYYWVVKSLALAFICGLFFSYAPSVVVHRNVKLPPAYELKADQPFADTSQLNEPAHEVERLHGAKLTPRITGSILLWVSNQASFHPYLPASLFGFIFLTSGIVVAYQITGDRVSGCLMGLLFAGLHASSACFSINWMPKPFDGVAIGLLGLSAACRSRPWFLFLLCFAACWTDERAIQGMLFLAVLFHAWPNDENVLRYRPLFILGGAVAMYLATRLFIAMALGWRSPDMNLMSPPMKLAVSFAQLAAWTSFEGGWLIIGSALLMMARAKAYVRLGVLSCAIVLAIAASLIVLDTSRVGAFSFPLVLAALAHLQHAKLPSSQIRQILGFSSIITLLAPNYEIIVGVAVKWLPSFISYLLLSG